MTCLNSGAESEFELRRASCQEQKNNNKHNKLINQIIILTKILDT
jgi:hypothetical protein